MNSYNFIFNKYLLFSMSFIFSCNYLFASDLDRAIAQSLSEMKEEEEMNAIIESVLLASLEEQSEEKQKSETSDFTILKARTHGDGSHIWDCSWEILKNASYIYKTLKNNNVVKQDISNIPYDNWFPTIYQKNVGDKLQIPFEKMQEVIKNNKLLDNNSYTSIEDIQALQSLDLDTLKQVILNFDNIKQLRKSNATFAFFINPGGHWFTVVAHNKNGKIHFYIADDNASKRNTLYKDTIKLLKRLI